MNQKLFLLINNFAGENNILDFWGMTIAEYLPYFFILCLLFLWFKNKKYQEIALFAGYSVILSLSINKIIGFFYFHYRPFADGLGKTLTEHLADSSFPSDHTTFMLAIALQFLLWKKTRKIGIGLTFLGIIGGISRVFTGVHYPFDILGAVLVSLFSAVMIYTFRAKFNGLNKLFLKIDKYLFRGKKWQ